ncbi:MAG TPA: biopolymer transporter ExbD [Gemmatimonadaceae bacterium]|jgi:biopolymer transport protein ExbD|nr:biopolymer transporter ExbD [Gemmatimonadaceae bacterium]
MSMSTGGGQAIKAEPNVTPMIDVMLVLLIIFMIIIPQVNAGFAAVPPQGVNLKPHPEEDEDQVLGIDAQGNYYLNRAMIRKDQLESELKRIFDARTEDKILYVKADRNLEYDKVLEALDLAAANGVRVTGMITEQVAGTEQLVAEGQTVDPSVRPGGTE